MVWTLPRRLRISTDCLRPGEIVGFPGLIECMSAHPVDGPELVVRTHRPMPDGPGAATEFPVKTFLSRTEANTALEVSKDH